MTGYDFISEGITGNEFLHQIELVVFFKIGQQLGEAIVFAQFLQDFCLFLKQSPRRT